MLSAKEFFKRFREKEKVSYGAAIAFADECLKYKILPASQGWKVYLEMADCAKRANKFDQARTWYKTVLDLEKEMPHGWLEYAKMEEECGRLKSCEAILTRAQDYCGSNDGLLIKCLKYFERIGATDKIDRLKFILSKKDMQKCWKVLLELALLDARLGRMDLARQQLQALRKGLPWCSPVLFETAKLEDKLGHGVETISLAEQGLSVNSRFGPLWFLLFQALESREIERDLTSAQTNPLSTNNLERYFGVDQTLFAEPSFPLKGDFSAVHSTIQRSLATVSKEVFWKIWLQSAATYVKAGDVVSCRKCLSKAALTSPKSLTWKVWLTAARFELFIAAHYSPDFNRNTHKIEALLKEALATVPKKSISLVLVEMSRLAELTSSTDDALQLLELAKLDLKSEWRVYLELALLLRRSNRVVEAFDVLSEAVERFNATGRLWAVRVCLAGSISMQNQVETFEQALKHVPKSGEVWCEGAKMAMNPCYPLFCLKTARQRLKYAIQFTPQYGDSFVESIRFLMLTVLLRAKYRMSVPALIKFVKNTEEYLVLRTLCFNADPNYGTLWLTCKRSAREDTYTVLERVLVLMAQELKGLEAFYMPAMKGRPADYDPKYSFADGLCSVGHLISKKDDLSYAHKFKLIYGLDLFHV